MSVGIIKSTVLTLNQYHPKQLMLISLLQKVLMLLWDLQATVREDFASIQRFSNSLRHYTAQ